MKLVVTLPRQNGCLLLWLTDNISKNIDVFNTKLRWSDNFKLIKCIKYEQSLYFVLGVDQLLRSCFIIDSW